MGKFLVSRKRTSQSTVTMPQFNYQFDRSFFQDFYDYFNKSYYSDIYDGAFKNKKFFYDFFDFFYSKREYYYDNYDYFYQNKNYFYDFRLFSRTMSTFTPKTSLPSTRL